MAYSNFTSLRNVARTFGLRTAQDIDLLASVRPVDVGPFLQETLQENLPLALAIHTAKARSALIIYCLIRTYVLYWGCSKPIGPPASCSHGAYTVPLHTTRSAQHAALPGELFWLFGISCG